MVDYLRGQVGIARGVPARIKHSQNLPRISFGNFPSEKNALQLSPFETDEISRNEVVQRMRNV